MFYIFMQKQKPRGRREMHKRMTQIGSFFICFLATAADSKAKISADSEGGE
jgi:hypothetical protein